MNLDGPSFELLNPGDANHATAVAESSNYFVDNASRVDEAPTSALSDTTGTLLLKLEVTDVSSLEEAGFRFATPSKVKADDGTTDLYG